MTTPFQSLDAVRAVLKELPTPDESARDAARARDAILTKPPGALGRLEELAIWTAGWQGTDRPRINSPQIIVFAGNHGVTVQNISAFPAEVTAQMVANFETGGAAINQLAKAAGAKLDVVAIDLERPTADISNGPAMAETEVLDALNRGWSAVDADTDLLVVGEMGIGNTTSAAAIAYALFGGSAREWCGRGTGLDDAGVAHKAQVVEAAVAANQDNLSDGLAILMALGGRELAAMVGAILSARSKRVPVLLDGFIATAAAATLEHSQNGALDHIISAHVSAEASHHKLLKKIDKSPLFDFGLRLGEGSGAALAIPLLRAALACHSDMATFAEAGVADG